MYPKSADEALQTDNASSLTNSLELDRGATELASGTPLCLPEKMIANTESCVQFYVYNCIPMVRHASSSTTGANLIELCMFGAA